jgi:hypothetical protein
LGCYINVNLAYSILGAVKNRRTFLRLFIGNVFSQSRLPKKGCRELHAGGLGVTPQLKILPQEWGIKEVDKDFFSTLQKGKWLHGPLYCLMEKGWDSGREA